MAVGCTVTLVVVLLLTGVDGKRRSKTSSDRSSRLERTQCEEGPCSEWDTDYRPNCVLRCQSDACYTAVYADNELEPGEVDTSRSRQYQTCLTKERSDRMRVERERSRRRG
ncbi:hypothetical protein KFE25_006608 [Diacronema lutheri]|uniref:Secreted protein n=1 Tax=Diacronema lutheri TaxID=2081491 RepID=A0A8J6C308_DIALT|nr:hypothetical protein KFE25_006608 [Diacronema lutheri]